MRQETNRRIAPLFLAGAVLGLLALAGCGKSGDDQSKDANKPRPGPSADESTMPAEFAAGKTLFDANCAKCHTTTGKGAAPGGGGPKGMKGPDLAKVGAAPEHTRAWFVETIRDPRTHNPKSRMPKFEGKLNEGNLAALADYLGSLR